MSEGTTTRLIIFAGYIQDCIITTWETNDRLEALMRISEMLPDMTVAEFTAIVRGTADLMGDSEEGFTIVRREVPDGE